MIDCYPGLLNQAIMNLVSNAIDAIEDSGKVTDLDGQPGRHVFDRGRRYRTGHPSQSCVSECSSHSSPPSRSVWEPGSGFRSLTRSSANTAARSSFGIPKAAARPPSSICRSVLHEECAMLQTIATATATTTAKERVLLVDDEPQVLVALEDLLGDKFVRVQDRVGGSRPRADGARARHCGGRHRSTHAAHERRRAARQTCHSNDALRIMVTGYADLVGGDSRGQRRPYFRLRDQAVGRRDLRVKVDRAAEHFRLTKELAYERQLLHDLMNNMPDVIYFKDSDLRFLRVNQGVRQNGRRRRSRKDSWQAPYRLGHRGARRGGGA